jgi:rhamnogalacturonan endolyase
VRHGPTLDGWLDGSLQLLSPENVVVNGSAALSSDLLVPGSPGLVLNGNPLLGGVVEGPGVASPNNHSVVLNGGAVVRKVVRRVDAVPMPLVPAPLSPTGSRSVTLNRASDRVGDFSTLRDLTLNGNAGTVAVPPGRYGDFTVNGGACLVFGVAGGTDPAVYDLQRLTLNEGSKLVVVGPVRITLANGVTLSGTAGDVAHPRWLQLRFASGGLTLNGAAKLHGDVLAPAGTVLLNDGTLLDGETSCDRLQLNLGATLGSDRGL